MSANEEEVKGQIAEMRQALESAKESRRIATYVRAVGTLLGFVIVGLFVWLGVYRPFMRLAENPEPMREAAREQLETLQLGDKMMTIAREAAPTYAELAQEIAQDVGLMEAVQEQARLLAEDLRPTLEEAALAQRGPVREALEQQARRATEDLRAELNAIVRARLRSTLREQEASLQRETGLSEQKFALLVQNLNEAVRQAFINMAKRREGDLVERLEAIGKIVKGFPEVPPMSEEQLLEHTGRTLIALLKYKLPEYDFEEAMEQRQPEGPTGRRATALPAEEGLREAIADLQEKLEGDLPEESKQQLRRQIDQLQQQLKVLSGAASRKQKIESLVKALQQPDLSEDQEQKIRQQLQELRQPEQGAEGGGEQ